MQPSTRVSTPAARTGARSRSASTKTWSRVDVAGFDELDEPGAGGAGQRDVGELGGGGPLVGAGRDGADGADDADAAGAGDLGRRPQPRLDHPGERNLVAGPAAR